MSATYTAQRALSGTAVISANTSPTSGSINTYNASGGARTPTLPALSSLNVGAWMLLEKDTLDTSANKVTFTAAGADTFQDLSTGLVLSAAGEQVLVEVVQPVATKYFKVISRSYALGGVPSVAVPQAGINNFNHALQTQLVVSGTAYYIANSNLVMPVSPITGMIANKTAFVWEIAMAKTAAGTGTFQTVIYRGTNGSTADTADVTQTLGTQTAVIDEMVLNIMLVVTAAGGTGSYYWTIIPNNRASVPATPAGFGIPGTGSNAFFSNTVSPVALNTAGLAFGIGFISTTGTPTITVPMVQAYAYNMN